MVKASDPKRKEVAKKRATNYHGHKNAFRHKFIDAEASVAAEEEEEEEEDNWDSEQVIRVEGKRRKRERPAPLACRVEYALHCLAATSLEAIAAADAGKGPDDRDTLGRKVDHAKTIVKKFQGSTAWKGDYRRYFIYLENLILEVRRRRSPLSPPLAFLPTEEPPS